LSTINSTQVGVAALLLVAVFSICSLLAGASYLDVWLPGGLPLGNLLAAAVFSGPAGAAVLLAGRAKWVRLIATTVLLVSLAWLPVSIVLAGNAALNFSGGERGTIWAWFSAGLCIAVVAALLLAVGAALLARRGQSGAA
jgi:hypothetical protein